MCRSLPCGAAFSACGKYIASGSEDKSVFVYDLRQITHAYRLNDHQMDIVTSVAFVPKNSQIKHPGRQSFPGDAMKPNS
ncbi:WD repeat-containing protein 27-like isoform X2 [Stegodyphus dumicola]|uniref:WD repeat-containing protein 27-like isoform X2 n=1 Tax=Stegodyphus dumicola TaxID=202533 RepID=UPI0015B16955|nr:WD repeat-containing protein 27-like isoform X2 [Stegodyphus dumicola]